MIIERPKTRPTFDEMIATASEWFGVTPESVRLPGKRPRVVKARRMVIWNARLSGYSISETAGAVCRDHSTISTTCKKMGIGQ